MRLQLGSGDRYWPGFVNCDKFNTNADVICDVVKLDAFRDGEASEIHAIHIFEHIHRMQSEKALMEWFRVLKPGGKLVLELPCLDKIVEMIQAKEKNIRLTLLGLYGDPREEREGMEHKWGWSMDELTWQLRAVGFENIEFPEPCFHIPARDMRCVSYKPLSTT